MKELNIKHILLVIYAIIMQVFTTSIITIPKDITEDEYTIGIGLITFICILFILLILFLIIILL